MAPPALGTPAPRRPAMRAAGRPSAVLPVFEAESQQPGNFSLDVQDRMGGVQLLLQPSHFRLELVHLRAEGVALGGLPTAFARGQALKRPLTPRPAPFRQMGAVQPLAAEAAGPPRRAACSSLPPPESAVDTAR